MKLCKDCVHHHKGNSYMYKPRCLLHSQTRRSPVSGDIEFMTNVFCDAINLKGNCPDHNNRSGVPLHAPYTQTNLDPTCSLLLDPEPQSVVDRWLAYLAAWCRALWAAVRKAYING